ncbi:hypothetical protein AgCh_040223 [Apium graveolens]
MGEGTFGQVLKCWDKEGEEMVATKVVRGVEKYWEAIMIEVDVLQQLGKNEKGGDMSSGIFGFVEGFYQNHMEEVIRFFETHHNVTL